MIVPSGASCVLNGTRVDGNVLVGPNARLTVDGAVIDGNIQDDNGNAGAVIVRNATIDGDIQLERGTSVSITRTTVSGGDHGTYRRRSA